MRAHVSNELSVDKETLICVRWEREGPEAGTPTMEAVFQYNTPDTFELTNLKPGVLMLLSVTRTDTRIPVTMTAQEQSEVYQLASDYASNF